MYALCGMIGILLAGFVFCRLLLKRGQSDNDGVLLLVFSALGCVMGSHLLYGLTLIPKWGAFLKVSTAKDFFLLLGYFFGGGVFYGGLIGGLHVALIYIKKRKLNAADYADCGAICIPLFHSFARVGCFFAGCCYGIEVDWGFASSHNPLVPEVVGIRRFPTPLLEALLNLGLFLMLFLLRNKKALHGKLIYLYLGAYAIVRFCVEFLRGDTARGIWFGLSTSQWISLCMLTISVASLLYAHKKRNRETVAAAS
ncbi:MAG: prolipoprotein diacylglyceryl transferase [Clostridia bacterium]|nr:prolipoprotein diacylglyceryl transferase [Clostridia bacterium]